MYKHVQAFVHVCTRISLHSLKLKFNRMFMDFIAYSTVTWILEYIYQINGQRPRLDWIEWVA